MARPPHAQKYLDLFCPIHTEEERKALLRRFNPSIPEEFRSIPAWQVSLNADGFRDDEFPLTKSAGTIRIVAVGDSWTFGHGADQELGYPKRLAALLREDLAGKPIEVLNLGMLAFSCMRAQLRQQKIAAGNRIVSSGSDECAAFGWHTKSICARQSG